MIKLFFLLIFTFSFGFADEFATEFEALLQNPNPAMQTNQNKPTQTQKQEVLQKTVIAKTPNWLLLKASPKGLEVCYSLSYSQKRVGNIKEMQNTENLKAYLMVHYFSPYKKRISIFFNYRLQKGSKVFLSIDGTQFELSSFEDYAFAEDANTDNKILQFLMNAKRVLIRGEGENNTYSVDEYDVSGFYDIFLKMKEKCGEI